MTRTRYTVAALGVLAAVDGLHGYAGLVLGPDIAHTLGVGPGTIAAVGVLGVLMVALGGLPLAALARARRSRAAASVAAGGAWALTSALASVVTGPWGLAGVAAADGASTSSVRTLHPALIADAVPRGARVRALAAHRALDALGLIAGPALIAALSAAGYTWRGVFLGIAAVSVVAVLAAAALRDPGIAASDGGAPLPPPAFRPTLAERARALLAVPAIRRVLAAKAVTGVLLAPLLAYLFFHLEGRWGLDAAGRGACLALAGATSVAALALLAAEGERRLAEGPAALVAVLWPVLVATGAALLLTVLAPSIGVMLAGLCVAIACLALVQAGTFALLVTLAPPEARTDVTALAGVAVAGVGGLGGLLLLGGMESSLGLAAAIGALALPAAAAGLVLRSAGPLAATWQRVAAAPAPGALLAARALAVDFGEHRALDDVSLTVAPGEAVAVLGTNGAGKSTLLRALAGFAPPTRGEVRLDGHDITYLDPERRTALGLRYVDTGAAGFSGLTVREALAATTLASGGDAAAGAALARFPLLAARADVPAVALSEGERRLLALAPALVAPPRLLLVDEPTAGLAPEAAAAVIELLRAVVAAGAALLVVEQSLDAAAALAPRACFLEGGRMRFSGPTEQLHERSDLLRPVFLAAAVPA